MNLASTPLPRLPSTEGGLSIHRRPQGDDPTACDFQRWVGSEGWRRLAPDIRQRFSEKPAPDHSIRYTGTMQQVDCSAIGWLFAQALRMIGTPFAPHRGREVPVDITLRDAADGGIAWDRTYRYPGREPVLVRSVKRGDARTGLSECVQHGLGMRLAVFEADGALHFLSLRYFFGFRGRRRPLPGFLSPGTAHVVHTDLGDGTFRFTFTLHHRLFGTLFRQDGVFHRATGAAS